MSTVEKSKGILDVGKHCHYCDKLDYLPFTCDDCKQVFCGDHRSPAAHDCTKKPDKHPSYKTSASSTLASKPSANVSATRPNSSPVARRANTDKQESHPQNNDIAANALSKLKSLFPKKEKSPSARVLAIQKLNQLKKSAKGDQAIPIANRNYFYLKRPKMTYNEGRDSTTAITRIEKTLPVYFSNDLLVAKLMDKAKELLDMSTASSSTAPGNALRLVVDGRAIPNSSKVKDEIPQASTVELTYV